MTELLLIEELQPFMAVRICLGMASTAGMTPVSVLMGLW